MSTLDKARETGQFFLTFCACPSKADLAHANGTVIAPPASDSETTELAESDGDVHPHLRQREPLRAIIRRPPSSQTDSTVRDGIKLFFVTARRLHWFLDPMSAR